MKVTWWVIGTQEQNPPEFVGWSCGTPGPLEDAAVYRSPANAEKKLKSLHKFCPGEYQGYSVQPIEVKL